MPHTRECVKCGIKLKTNDTRFQIQKRWFHITKGRKSEIQVHMCEEHGEVLMEFIEEW